MRTSKKLEGVIEEAKSLIKVRAKLKALKDEEQLAIKEISRVLTVMGKDSIEHEGILIVKEYCETTNLDRDKVIKLIGEDKFEKCKYTTEYTKIKVKEQA